MQFCPSKHNQKYAGVILRLPLPFCLECQTESHYSGLFVAMREREQEIQSLRVSSDTSAFRSLAVRRKKSSFSNEYIGICYLQSKHYEIK